MRSLACDANEEAYLASHQQAVLLLDMGLLVKLRRIMRTQMVPIQLVRVML